MVEDTGRCVNCGFLGKLRSQIDAETFVYEATRYNRETGTFYRYSGHPEPRDISTQITCFRNAANLQKELVDALAMDGQRDRNAENEPTLTLIKKPRKCKSWYLWTEHRSPKEHFEEFKMQQLEKERREFDLKLFELSQKIQNDSKVIVEKGEKFNRRITWFIIISAILEVTGTLLALFLPNGFGGQAVKL